MNNTIDTPAQAGVAWTDNIEKLLLASEELNKAKEIVKQLTHHKDCLEQQVHDDMRQANMPKATFGNHDIKRSKAYFGKYKTLKQQIMNAEPDKGLAELLKKHNSLAMVKSAIVISLPTDNQVYNQEIILKLREFINETDDTIDCEVLSEINPQTLKKFIRLSLENDAISDDDKTEIKEFFEVFVKETITIKEVKV